VAVTTWTADLRTLSIAEVFPPELPLPQLPADQIPVTHTFNYHYSVAMRGVVYRQSDLHAQQ
jgi:hypothetical protein